jgi:glutamate/tyrosine decarboxylase-like PLP-dependent enzyme
MSLKTEKKYSNMHNVDMGLVEMSLDVIKFAIGRITQNNPELGFPKKAEELKSLVGETITAEGIGGEKAFALFKDTLIKASVPIDHPRHLAFVPAAPTRAAVMFDLVTSASSVHGAFWLEGAGLIFAENQAMEWLVSLTGMPKGTFGVFTSGGTAANLSAMVTARERWRSKDKNKEREKGIVIAARTAHSSIKAMAKVIDADVLLVNTKDRLEGTELRETLANMDVQDRQRVFAVIATGGTTNAGIIDDLSGIADVCREEDLWYHVDAAYGGGALAAKSVRHLFNGIEFADSVTIDPHKWLFSPYDCGAVIYKNPEYARQAHYQDGSYLDIFSDEGAQGFNPADYQIQLTRRVRGLPLWFSLAMHGTDRYEQAIERGIELAQIAGRLISESPHVELVREPSLSCVIFRRMGWLSDDYRDWTYKNHREGFALVAPTKWKTGDEFETVTRFCFINPDTTEKDIADILASMA